MIFSSEAIEDAKRHAVDVYPAECCGMIVDGVYHRCDNVAEDINVDFRIPNEQIIEYGSKGKIECVVHSHDSWGHPSRADQEKQIKAKIPYCIINVLPNKRIDDVFWWGDQIPPDPLVGRRFRNGSHDCYALVRDWYRLRRDILLPTYPHRLTWFNDKLDDMGNVIEPAIDLIVDNVRNAGFDFVSTDELRVGDVLLARDKCKLINHTGVYVGKGKILHHLWGRLSCKEPVINYKKYVEKVARHVA